jgi:hypothetical protein
LTHDKKEPAKAAKTTQSHSQGSQGFEITQEIDFYANFTHLAGKNWRKMELTGRVLVIQVPDSIDPV